MIPNIDIIKDFSNLQSLNKELGKTNIILLNRVKKLENIIETFLPEKDRKNPEIQKILDEKWWS
jgi:hypothetical protein